MKNNFNDCNQFEKELVETLASLLEVEIKEMLEYVVATHDLKPLNAVRKILNDNNFKRY